MDENNPLTALALKIQAAKKEIPADLVLKRARVVNVFSGTVQEGDVAIHCGFVVGVGPDYKGKKEVDLQGRWVTPGLIDGHIHIESSMLLPSMLARALLPHGTTTIVSDPHEIANVMGLEGIEFLLNEVGATPFDIYFTAPSCVPATHLETSGAKLGASELARVKENPKILGLGEVMNFPGLLGGEREVLEKLLLFQDRIIDGHAPSLRGAELQAYLSAGIRSDHETTDPGEALEKVESGMMLMVREGTSAKNLDKLLPLITDRNSRRFCFVSDDLHPRDILRRGHLNFLLKKAVAAGLDPVTAVQMVTLNPAEYFGLKDRGAVAPGYRADLAVLEDLDRFSVERVYKEGRLVVEDGELIPFPSVASPRFEPQPLNIAPFSPESFRIRAEDKKARIIELLPGEIITGSSCERLKSENGWVVPDRTRDILKITVVERHRGTGRIGLGLVKGFGLSRGAIASSVAHDSHNVIAVGVSDRALFKAVEGVRRMGGGIAVAEEGKVLAKTSLEVAGLMSRVPLGDLVEQLEVTNRAALSLGCKVPEPFMALSFLALPVIPELKLTDLGLVDVNRFEIVPLFVET